TTFALLLAAVATPAAADDFPLGKPYKAMSISGFDVIKAQITLTVARNDKKDLIVSGHAGCNSYTAAVQLREDQFDVSDVVTTRKFCGKPRMTTEEAYLTALKSAHQWKVDGDKLIIEGDTARLMLKAGTWDKKK